MWIIKRFPKNKDWWVFRGWTCQMLTMFITTYLSVKERSLFAPLNQILYLNGDSKIHIVKGIAFPVIIYEYVSWTIKKAECQRIAAFELWCWRRLLRVFWTAGRSNQSILKEISPEYSLEGLILNLQYFGLWCEQPTH